jgi:hypothetical protein
MNIRSTLLKEHSLRQTKKLAGYIGIDKNRFHELIEMVLSEDVKLAQRAAWVLGTHGENHPELIIPHLKELLNQMEKPVHDAVKRNILRVLQYLEIPPKYESRIADICFRLIGNSGEAIAVKAFSITVITNLSRKYPELRQELKSWYLLQSTTASKAVIKRMEKAGLI